MIKIILFGFIESFAMVCNSIACSFDIKRRFDTTYIYIILHYPKGKALLDHKVVNATFFTITTFSNMDNNIQEMCMNTKFYSIHKMDFPLFICRRENKSHNLDILSNDHI